MTDSGTKCAWMIHESKAVQIHVHNNSCCLHVPRVPGSVKNRTTTLLWYPIILLPDMEGPDQTVHICCLNRIMSRLICKKDLILFLFPRRTYILDVSLKY